MVPIDLRRLYIKKTITILDIIHNPAFYLKHCDSETGFYPRLKVEPTQLGPIDISSGPEREKE
jgi:hypothetical protein